MRRVLSPFDDYPLHQSPFPIAHAGTGDRNAYERYFFNGYDRSGGVFFAAALGVYPNREVIDAAFSVVHAGEQRSVHASARLGPDRVRTAVGPIAIDVEVPMRRLRVTVDAADLGVLADVVFTARTPAVEEPPFRSFSGPRPVFDYTRLTQWGTWTGSIAVDGLEHRVDGETFLGCRDRSWGIRPVGEPVGGAPAHELPQFFWLWAPLHFDDRCAHLDVNEYEDGRRWHQTGMLVPVLTEDAPADAFTASDDIVSARGVAYEIEWEPGTRRAARAAIALELWSGSTERIDLEPVLTFPMRGLGYLSPDWNHGSWRGELEVGTESWRVDDLDPTEPWNVHVQQLVRARWGEREGIGVFEQLVINAHQPTGLTGLFDGAPHA
jgi:hypothetical protein